MLSRTLLHLACALAAPALFAVGGARAAPADPARACPAYPFAHPKRQVTEAQVTALLKAAIARHWLELGPYDVSIKTFTSAHDYFKSEVAPGTVLRSARKRRYHVQVNSQLLADAPADAALTAIIVHELSHVHDYTQMSSVRFAEFAIGYATRPQAAYERQTDGAPLRRGLGCGLMEYRVWLYARLDPKTLALKKKNYFTPAEIAEWMAAHPGGK